MIRSKKGRVDLFWGKMLASAAVVILCIAATFSSAINITTMVLVATPRSHFQPIQHVQPEHMNVFFRFVDGQVSAVHADAGMMISLSYLLCSPLRFVTLKRSRRRSVSGWIPIWILPR